ncbi:MAG: hypothetical protein WAW85_10225 [Gordonia sp. (in: high G+C Gram-positive bacteria)]|uniref:hypothetical protein n=1 Tax=Gordonia sp. (in: high G+C Gram-positive bacteria) TaxID=84139 RepID=UPI003BB49EC7
MRKLLATTTMTAAAAVALISLPIGTGTASAAPTMAEDYRIAAALVSGYWQQQAPKLYGERYVAPTNRGIIDPGTETGCGAMPKQNAAYCPKDHSVQFGRDYMELADSIGDVVVYDVVAHEWAHAVLRQQPDRVVERPQELQAECLAGGALGDLKRSGHLIVEDGDDAEFAALFRYTHAPGDKHGTAKEQATAFMAGWKSGPRACFTR